MDQQTVRKTYKLIPTPAQQRELGRVLGLCRWLYNTALEQRITAFRRAGVSLSRYQQEAELKDIRAFHPPREGHQPAVQRPFATVARWDACASASSWHPHPPPSAVASVK